MVIYYILFILSIILALIAFFLLAISAFCGFDFGPFALFLIVLTLCGLCIWGATTIENNNTTTTVETIQMEVVKLDLTDTYSKGFGTQTHYYMSVNDNEGMSFVLDITSDEYVKYNIGDLVDVEVTTKVNELMDETTKTAKLGGIENA